jgi:hypothetical protein
MKKKISDYQFPMPKEAIEELNEQMPYGAMIMVSEHFSERSKPTIYSHLKSTRKRYSAEIILAFLEIAETQRRVNGIKEKLKIRVYLESLFKHYDVVDRKKNSLTLKPFEN